MRPQRSSCAKRAAASSSGSCSGSGPIALLKGVDQYPVEVLLTLAAVMGGSSLASHLHVSGPLAMVVVGLVIGNRGRA